MPALALSVAMACLVASQGFRVQERSWEQHETTSDRRLVNSIKTRTSNNCDKILQNGVRDKIKKQVSKRFSKLFVKQLEEFDESYNYDEYQEEEKQFMAAALGGMAMGAASGNFGMVASAGLEMVTKIGGAVGMDGFFGFLKGAAKVSGSSTASGKAKMAADAAMEAFGQGGAFGGGMSSSAFNEAKKKIERTKKEVRSNHQEQTFQEEQLHETSEMINENVLKVWGDCMNLQKKDVQVDIDATPNGQGLTISLTQSTALPTKILKVMIVPPDAAECTVVNTGSPGEARDITVPHALTTQRPAHVGCNRIDQNISISVTVLLDVDDGIITAQFQDVVDNMLEQDVRDVEFEVKRFQLSVEEQLSELESARKKAEADMKAEIEHAKEELKAEIEDARQDAIQKIQAVSESVSDAHEGVMAKGNLTWHRESTPNDVTKEYFYLQAKDYVPYILLGYSRAEDRVPGHPSQNVKHSWLLDTQNESRWSAMYVLQGVNDMIGDPKRCFALKATHSGMSWSPRTTKVFCADREDELNHWHQVLKDAPFRTSIPYEEKK